jgi:hypothetical protein
LLDRSDISRSREDLGRYSSSLQNWLGDLSTAVESLEVNHDLNQIESLPAQQLLQQESAHWTQMRKMLYAYHFDLMMRSGMADEWMGVGPNEPNAVRDFVRLHLSTGVWKLISRGTPDSPLPDLPTSRAERILRVARRVRHHPWLCHMFTALTKLPVYKPLKAIARRMLHVVG